MAPTDRAFRGDFSGGILASVGPDGKVEIMVVGVIEKVVYDQLRAEGCEPTVEDLDIKLPGGCADNPEATTGQVLEGEIRQECFEGQCTLGPTLLVLERRKPNTDPNAFSKIHIQRFYLITRWDGELRVRDLLEDEGDEYLTPPMMFEFRRLYHVIFGTHQEPIFRALEALAKNDSRVAEEYADLLAQFNAGKIRRPPIRRR